MTEHAHADLDLLADVLAGETPAEALGDCADCGAALAELTAADARVSAGLRDLADPPLPVDLAARLDAALARAAGGEGTATAGADDGSQRAPTPGPSAPPPTTATVTTLPTGSARRTGLPGWLGAAAAAVVVLGGAVLGTSLVTGGLGSGADDTGAETATASGAGLAGLVRNDTGSTYTTTNLAAAVPGLLSGDAERVGDGAVAAPAPMSADTGTTAGAESGGTTGAATGGSGGKQATRSSSAQSAAPDDADALARLRTEAGLADCLVALLPPDDDSVVPLALDYGSFTVDGAPQPALLVVLPVPGREDKLDVFVVGAGCAQADEQLLHFARVDRPAR
jgi:hypothetical protein